jgi:dTDP-4-dehydrorhamnose reductase
LRDLLLKRILVTGAGGLLGSKLVHVLSREYEVTPTHNMKPPDPNSLRMDIVDKKAVLRVFNMVSPDMVVHAAAMTNVDRCETNRELAWNINVLGTMNIAERCAENGARLIYVSTDYVFDGDKGCYEEDDEANPINYYGLTKLKGEEFVREFCKDSVIARTSVVYGWHPTKVNFATWVVDSLRNRRRINVAEDHYNSPTLADDLAEIIGRIMGSKGFGVYHASGSERISRFEFALKIADTFELDRSLLKPVKMRDIEAWIAKRPKDSSLCVDKLRENLGIEPLGLAEALKKMKSLEPEAIGVA